MTEDFLNIIKNLESRLEKLESKQVLDVKNREALISLSDYLPELSKLNALAFFDPETNRVKINYSTTSSIISLDDISDPSFVIGIMLEYIKVIKVKK